MIPDHDKLLEGSPFPDDHTEIPQKALGDTRKLIQQAMLWMGSRAPSTHRQYEGRDWKGGVGGYRAEWEPIAEYLGWDSEALMSVAQAYERAVDNGQMETHSVFIAGLLVGSLIERTADSESV